MNWPHRIFAGFIIAVLLVFVFGIYHGEQTLNKKQEFQNECAETDLKVWVGGRVNRALTIYDCSK